MTSTAQTLAALLDPPRGVLVVDEYAESMASGTPGSGIPAGGLARMVLDTPGLDAFVSGVLLTRDGLGAVEPAARGLPGDGRGLLVGVRMDPAAVRGLDDDPDHQGSAALRDAMRHLAATRVSFVEWRAHVPPGEVEAGEVHVEARTLAVGAAVSQELGLLPMLTVAMPDLATHSIGVSQAVTANALRALRRELVRVGADPAAILLRTNMVHPGELHPTQASAEQVARATLRVLRESVPDEVPGVVFLSSGQSLERASENLAAIMALGVEEQVPWRLSFGFARPLVTAPVAAVQPGHDAGEALLDSCRRVSEAAHAALVPGARSAGRR